MLQKLILSTDITEFTDTAQLVTTEYSDLKVPAGILIFLGVAMVLFLAVTVVGFIIIKNHCVNWGYSILYGIVAFLLFSYFLYNLVFLGIGNVPALRDSLLNNGKLVILCMLVFGLIFEFLSVFLGLKYIISQCEKRSSYYDIGTPAIFALAIYTIILFMQIPNSLISAPLNGFFNYFTLFTTVNTVGFDPFVSNMIQNGADMTVVDELLNYINQDALSYVFETIWTIARLAYGLPACVITYGVIRGKLEKKYLGLTALIIFLSFLPKALLYINVNVIICIAASVVMAAAVFYYTLRLVKNRMPEELDRVSHKIQKRSRREEEKNKPMPKIVMPKD